MIYCYYYIILLCTIFSRATRFLHSLENILSSISFYQKLEDDLVERLSMEDDLNSWKYLKMNTTLFLTTQPRFTLISAVG